MVLATPASRRLRQLVPQFEKSANHKVKTTWAGHVDVLKRIKAGEAFDAVDPGVRLASRNCRHEQGDGGQHLDVARSWSASP